ncbi:M15 family metallopeptidase [Gracilibacillus sp. HCP3S3_G5_1]|uniref:M15 family metallopeptidase n=1 Tax=unclassified Gracilibacillus TaxID=2625209 RepID=UPI003F8B9FE4
MTVSLKTLLDRSERNMGSKINSVVKEAAIEVIKRAYKEGIYVQISEGYRSNARQNELYAQGRTTSGKVVTNAKGGQSYHNYGLAVDYFLVSDDGKKALWTVNSDWKRVAEIAKSLGFEWGGDWTSFKDYPHLQMDGGLSISQLQAGKRPSLNSKGSNDNKSYNVSISEDGYWGSETTTALQKALNSVVDGVISNQYRNNVTEAIGSGITFGKGGSLVVGKLQAKVGSKQDKYLGKNTIKALQGV